MIDITYDYPDPEQENINDSDYLMRRKIKDDVYKLTKAINTIESFNTKAPIKLSIDIINKKPVYSIKAEGDKIDKTYISSIKVQIENLIHQLGLFQ